MKFKYIIVISIIMCVLIIGLCVFNKKDVTTFDLCKITFDSGGGSLVESLEFVCGSKIDFDVTTEKEGYKFIGWYENDNEFDSFGIIFGDVNLIAKWEEINVEKVSFLKEEIELKKGESHSLKYTVYPSNALKKS